MANIDTSKIEGFEAMSAEDKLNALLGLEIPEEVDLTKYVKKSVFDAKASEAAELSKKLQGKLTEEEKAQEERDKIHKENEQKYTELSEKYEQLMKSTRISEFKAHYLALGYEESLAESTAKAFEEGDTATVFANEKKFREDFEKKIKSDLMKNDPHPNGAFGKKDKDEPGVTRAKEIGKLKAEENKVTADVMKHYT